MPRHVRRKRRIARNADDRLRKLERNRYRSLADAALWVEENLRLGRVVFSRPFTTGQTDRTDRNGVIDFSNGYSLWVWGGGEVLPLGAYIMLNALSPKLTRKHPWVSGFARPIGEFQVPDEVDSELRSPLAMLIAHPFMLPGYDRSGGSLVCNNKEQLLQLAQEVSSWPPVETMKAPKDAAEARLRGMTWL